LFDVPNDMIEGYEVVNMLAPTLGGQHFVHQVLKWYLSTKQIYKGSILIICGSSKWCKSFEHLLNNK
jgi:hypothetical protein